MSTPSFPAVLGLDIGGTKLAAGIVAPDGTVLSYLRAPTPPHADAETLLAAVVRLGREAAAASGVMPAAVGVGCGGPLLYPAGIVSPLHIPGWRDFPLRERLAAAFGLPALVDNDANARAVAEARCGAGRGARGLMGITVSTGVGSGLVIEGRLLHYLDETAS